MQVQVVGFYGHSNLGDNFFIDAFQSLFPEFHFSFTDHLTGNHLLGKGAVFIGGGSFLNEPLSVDNLDTFFALKQLPLFYLGVGAETDIHPHHQDLMSLARLVAIRTPEYVDKIYIINSNVMCAPDLVQTLIPAPRDYQTYKSVLVIPNIVVVPTWNDPHWQHAAWDSFKIEFAQFLDELIEQQYQVHFLPFCTDVKLNDEAVAHEIISAMRSRDSSYLLHLHDKSFYSVTELMSRYSAVITQRYHGAILAQMNQTPCMVIHHHDKLKHADGFKLPYYGITKTQLTNAFYQVQQQKTLGILSIDRNSFNLLTRRVKDALCVNQE